MKKLRSSPDKSITGVCGGIAEITGFLPFSHDSSSYLHRHQYFSM
ncbi:PspC domain-containing protein [Virgibacillus salexigens]|nr:PspC domain-containing protein [Virgibacillus massiliensis]